MTVRVYYEQEATKKVHSLYSLQNLTMKQLKFGHTSKSSGWHSTLTIRHPDEIQPGANSSGWLRVWITLRRPDDIGQHNTSPEWYPALTISHPHGIRPGANPSRWLMTNEVCHLDDISYHQMLSGWLTAMLSCHPKKMNPGQWPPV